MKVLMIGNHQNVKGGITSVISQILNYEWERDKIDMKFIPIYIEGGNFKKISFFIYAYVKIFFALLIYKPDVVHMHMSYRGSFHRKFYIHKLCKIFKKKDIIHLHGSEFKKWYEETTDKNKFNIRKLLRECDCMIVLGEEWERRIQLIEPRTNTKILRNTVKIPEEDIKWNSKPFQILYLGVLIKRKGVKDLLNAINILYNDYGVKDIRVVIAGSGEEEEELKEITEKLGLQDCVFFNGWTTGNEKIKLIKESQALVLPSYNEGMPIAILEAMSYGMPIIATQVGDIREQVLENENGYLISPGSVELLANRITLLLDKDKFTAFSKKSKEIAIEKFSDEIYFKNLNKLYLEIK